MTGASVSMNGPPSIVACLDWEYLGPRYSFIGFDRSLWQRRARSRRDHALRVR
jgi:hypothetical protein